MPGTPFVDACKKRGYLPEKLTLTLENHHFYLYFCNGEYTSSCANWPILCEAKSAKLGCEINIEASWSTNSSTIPLYNSEFTFSIRGNVANQKTMPRFNKQLWE